MKAALEIKESDWEIFKKYIEAGNVQQVQILLEADPSLASVKDKFDYSTLHIAAEGGHKKIAKILLKYNPELINAIDKSGQTPLHLGAWRGSEKVVRTLLHYKAELINAVDNSGCSVLHNAASGGNDKVVNMLLKYKPELVKAVDKSGYTVLHSAASCKNEKVIEILLKHKPELINAADNRGHLAFHQAALIGSTKVVEMFLRYKPELLGVVTDEGRSALHMAAWGGNEEVVEMLLSQMTPEAINAVNHYGSTALSHVHPADKEIIKMLLSHATSEAQKAIGRILLGVVSPNDFLEPLKDLKPEENKNANKLAPKNKKFSHSPEKRKKLAELLCKGQSYSKEKIHELLSLQLKSQNNIKVELIDLSNPANITTLEKQLQDFVEAATKENKIFAIGLHLHGQAWASLIIKHVENNNLQLIYNDPTGNAFSKEPVVCQLINYLTEQNQNGDTIITDLRKTQQNTENDSRVILVDNLVKLATASNLKKVDLQKLLLGPNQVDELKIKHLLILDTNLHYIGYKLVKLLELSLKDKPVVIAPIIRFEDEGELLENIQLAVKQIMDNGVPIIIPLSIQRECWSGLVIKNQGDSGLQVVYSNPTGSPLRVEKNSMTLIKAITDVHLEVHLIDLKYKQDEDKRASGAIIVSNLTKLVLNDTDNFHIKDFQKLLSTSNNIDQLRQQHSKMIHDYTMSDLVHKGDSCISLQREEREAFEHKGDYSEGKEAHAAAPPPYEEDLVPVMHVLGEDVQI